MFSKNNLNDTCFGHCNYKKLMLSLFSRFSETKTSARDTTEAKTLKTWAWVEEVVALTLLAGVGDSSSRFISTEASRVAVSVGFKVDFLEGSSSIFDSL